MISPDAIQRILGVENASDAHALLGLQRGRAQTHEIESALRERLATVFQHPEGRGEDAEFVRRKLRDAAEQLKRELRVAGISQASSTGEVPSWIAPRKPTQEAPLFHLTAFDRMVLAVLVASGGWNAQSRGRLVALAAAHGITVQGLMRVVQGLSQYARAGGARLGVNEITAGQSMSQYFPPMPTGSVIGSTLLDQLAEGLSAELKRDSFWTTIKLAGVFAVLTLGVLIVAVRVVFYTGDAPSRSSSPTQATAAAPSSFSTPTPTPPPQPSSNSNQRRITTFPKIPTFLGNALPGESIKAAEQFAVIPARLDELARKLVVEDQPSEAVFRLWEAEVETIALGWQLADSSTRRQIDAKLSEAIRAASDRPTVSDRMLNSLLPPQTIAAPLDVWRGVYKVATVWRIAAASDQLPPVVTQRAGVMLQSILPDSHRASEDAAAAWLDSVTPQLVGMIELNEQSDDFWELWLTAQRGLGKGERHDASIMKAMGAVLATDTDLARPGRTVNVLARLLNIAIESGSPLVRIALQSYFDDESIPSRDLWVLTSLLSMNDNATWFPDGLVLPDDADMNHRFRIRDELRHVWPEQATLARGDESNGVASGRPLAVDEHLAWRWATAAAALQAQPLPTEPEEIVRRIIQTSRLSEAAHSLVAQDHPSVEATLLEMESDPEGKRIVIGRRSLPRVGQPIGPDAQWATLYQEAGKSAEQRIEAIRTLRSTSAGDLGPIDAALLVREAYRASPSEVRVAAQEIVLKFNNGPNVSQAMLDQFGDAPATEPISKVISDFTSQPLPNARDAGWAVAARVALIQNALHLLSDVHSDVDTMTVGLADSFAVRFSSMRGERSTQSAARPPQEMAAAIATLWLEQAGPLRVANPLPDTLLGLNRRRAMRGRLVVGPMQQFAAHQLAILDLAAYVAVAEQPAKRDVVAGILRNSANARSAATSVLEQSLHIERAIVRIWRVRFGLSDSTVPDASTSATREGENAASATARVIHPPANLREAWIEPWLPRLEALSPSNPIPYFELAEEVADASDEAPGRDLARWLFAVAGAIDPNRLGRSACLALADMETDAQHKRRLLALASLMGSSLVTHRAIDTSAGATSGLDASSAQSLAIAAMMSEGLGHYRNGQGARALEAFRKPGVTELLKQFERQIGVIAGAERILDDCKHLRGSARPSLTPDQVVRMLRTEHALLSGEDRTWASDLLLFDAQPLIEVDPERLAETLGVDTTRIVLRDGRWEDR